MSHQELPDFDEVNDALVRLRVGVDAGELHGSLCGLVSGGGRATRSDWLEQLALEAETGTAAEPGSALEKLFDATCLQLDDDELGFALLLPDDATPVGQRADALLGWCRGFLGGFGLATGARQPLSAEAAEALEDLARIAGSALSLEDPDTDEESLAEISEFVRVAALLLHSECNRRSTPRRLH